MSTPITILGMHRSGTSMVAQLLHHCGLHLGAAADLIAANPDNQAGYWENVSFTQLNEAILQTWGGSWYQLPPTTPDWATSATMVPWQVEARHLSQALAVYPFWGWKDPRTSLTLPFWLHLLPELKIVVCLRHPIEVANSLSTRHDHWLAYDDALQLWLGYYEAIRQTAPPDRLIVTHYASMFYDAAAELHRLITFLGLPVTETILEQAIQHAAPSLQRHFTPQQANLPPEIQASYDAWCAQAGPVYERMQTDASYQQQTERQALTQAYQNLATIRQRHETARHQLEETARQLHQLQIEAALQREQLPWLRLTAAETLDTPGWPILYRWKAWTERAWPVGTRRFKLYRRLLTGLETVATQGIGAAWHKMRGREDEAAAFPPTFTLCTIATHLSQEKLALTYNSLQQQGDFPWQWHIHYGEPPLAWPDELVADGRVQRMAAANHTTLFQNANDTLQRALDEWLFFLAPGDRLPPDAFAQISHQVQANPQAEALLFQMQAGVAAPLTFPHEPLTARFVSHWLMGRGLVRRELLEKVGYFVPEKGAAAFWDLMLRMMEVRPRCLEIPLVIHYPHPNDEG